MNPIKELKEEIAVSLYLEPATEDELMERDFLKGYFIGNIQRLIMQLEKDAIYYKGETMYVYKSWAKKNLKSYELDFRTRREKYIDNLTDFGREVHKNKNYE